MQATGLSGDQPERSSEPQGLPWRLRGGRATKKGTCPESIGSLPGVARRLLPEANIAQAESECEEQDYHVFRRRYRAPKREALPRSRRVRHRRRDLKGTGEV